LISVNKSNKSFVNNDYIDIVQKNKISKLFKIFIDFSYTGCFNGSRNWTCQIGDNLKLGGIHGH